MAVTRINNNQISDASAGNVYVGINAAVKLQNYSVTATKIANNLVYGSDLTVAGNLLVQGNTTTIDTTYTTIEDPILLLASNQTGSPTVDIGFVGQRGISQNIAFVWDESAGEFVTVYTTTGESNTVVSISSYADLHTGNANIGGNVVVNGTTSLVGSVIGNVSITGNVVLGNVLTNGQVSAAGNITGANINSAGIASIGGNIIGGNVYTTGIVSAIGTVTGGYLYSSGAVSAAGNVVGGNVLSSGIISSSGNITSAGNITGGNLVLSSTTGNIIAYRGQFYGNVDVYGNLNATIGVVYANAGIFYGDTVTGNNAAYFGVPGYTFLGSDIVIQTTGNVNNYSQINFQNINNGTQSSTDFVLTADNGNDSSNFFNMGITGGSWDGTQLNSLGNALYPNDGYLYADSGNVVIGTAVPNDHLKVIVGGADSNYIVAEFYDPNTAATDVNTGTLTVKGGIGATGNIWGATLNATANITGGNILTGGLVSATGNITSAANVSGGNVLTSGQVSATGNITSSANIAGGNLLVTNIVSATSYIGSVVSVSANITGGNVLTSGEVSATGNITSSANVAGGNVLATNIVSAATVLGSVVSASANITGGNILTSGLISSTGNITSSANVQGANLIATANVFGVEASFSGNVSGGNLLTSGLISATGNITSSANITGGNVLTSGIISSSGNITGANLNTSGTVASKDVSATGNVYVDGFISATGNLYVAYVVSQGNLTVEDPLLYLTANTPYPYNYDIGFYSQFQTSPGDPTQANGYQHTGFARDQTDSTWKLFSNVVPEPSGTINFNNAVFDAFLSGPISSTGNITAVSNIAGGNLLATTTVSAASHIGSTFSASANITGGNLLTSGLISSTGNITSAANVAGGNLIATSNVVGAGASISGNISGGNLLTSGEVSATGNVTSAANIAGGNILATTLVNGTSITGTTISASANITGGNLLTGGLISSTGNITSAANINGANVVGTTIITAPSILGTIVSASSNITGGNLITSGVISATGNISTAGNITASYYFGNGSQLTGVNAVTSGFPVSAGTSNINAVSGGNIFVSIGGTPNVAVFATTGEYVSGLISATGNIISSANVNGGNLTTDGQVSASGDISGNNLYGIGVVSAAGNVIGGNVNTGGLITATGNITSAANVAGGNVVSSSLVQGVIVSASGNVVGGNVTTAGQVSATGNITSAANIAGGNVLATAVVSGASLFGSMASVSGNITGANLNTGGTNGLTLNASTINSNAAAISINSNLSDVNFAVNGTGANVFFVDAGTNTASFGSSVQTTNAIVAFNATNSILMPVGNTGQRPATGVTGMLRFNTTLDAIEVYDADSWTTVGAPVFTVIGDQQFSGDGSTVVFNLTGDPTTTAATIVSINGVVQIPTIAYAVSGAGGNILTFTEAPQTGDQIDVRVLTTTVSVSAITNTSGNAVLQANPTKNEISLVGNLVPTGNITQSLGSPTNYFDVVYANTTTAQNADLAEVYSADAKYLPGTVLSFGGSKEVTLSTVVSDTRIAGVVSTNPSYIMNSILESEFTATVALTGRVPTKVSGPVAKGDMMVSAGNGRAIACATPAMGTVIGKALENNADTDSIIEVVVGRL